MGKWQAPTAQNPLSFSNSFFLFSAFSLECVCVCVHARAHTQSRLTLWTMDCSSPGSSVHVMSQARILE